MINKFSYYFKTEDKYKHIEVPFDVPKNIDLINISLFNSTEDAVVDIGLRDSEKIRGWTGSNKKQITISEEYATPGYQPGLIKVGTWAVLLSPYKVPSAGCKVEITVTLIQKKWRWLKGDTHFHTIHSDGNANICEFIRNCKKNSFDYLISTNHNTNSQNYLLPSDMGVIIIPGIELTTYHGHAALVGIKQPIEDYRVSAKKDVNNKFIETKAKGGYVGINHPCADDNEGCVWDWGLDLNFDWLEIWNDTWSYMNENALFLWQDLLISGKKIPIIGGSDNHHYQRYLTDDLPVTYVYTNSLNGSSILSSLSKGHCYVSLKNGPFLKFFQAGKNILGETTENKTVDLNISALNNNDKICIVSEKYSHYYSPNSNGTFANEFKVTDEQFLRVEIRRFNPLNKTNNIILLSNPIYFKY